MRKCKLYEIGKTKSRARTLIQKDTNFGKVSDPGDQVYFSQERQLGKASLPRPAAHASQPPSLLGSISRAFPETPTPRGRGGDAAPAARPLFRTAAPLSGNGRTTSGPAGGTSRAGPDRAGPSPAASAGTSRPVTAPRVRPRPVPPRSPSCCPADPPRSRHRPDLVRPLRTARRDRGGGSPGAAATPPPAHRCRQPRLRPRPSVTTAPEPGGRRRAAPPPAPEGGATRPPPPPPTGRGKGAPWEVKPPVHQFLPVSSYPMVGTTEKSLTPSS
ncbi:uncharacterized protein LOC113945072 [Corapipo altera]|uniref:uncharacterized protein LOC113945072 n=1 Tax=Corapipo altera TaxID=415028 RepID=UPI000FD67960|nr:uncharacterized protein LOC113945072 [Corapipo altera]